MSYHAIVHIAGIPTEHEQRCMRCCAVLLGGINGDFHLVPQVPPPFAPGAYVAVIPGGSSVQEHDATGPDETPCNQVQR